MLTRVMAALTALLSFAVFTLAGLMRGSSFASVIKGSLVAMVLGAVVGAAVAIIVRTVVTESFNRQQGRERDASGTSPAAAQGQTQPRSASQGRAAEAATAGAQAAAWPKK